MQMESLSLFKLLFALPTRTSSGYARVQEGLQREVEIKALLGIMHVVPGDIYRDFEEQRTCSCWAIESSYDRSICPTFHIVGFEFPNYAIRK